MYKLSQLENIGVKFTEILQKEGIENQEQLLKACNLRQKRLALAQKTGINPRLIGTWATQADLARINGIGEDYAELLAHCEVDSIQTLSLWQAQKLLQILTDENGKNRLVGHLPSLRQITAWIEEAKTLPPVLEN